LGAHAIPGSQPRTVFGARVVGKPAPSTRMDVTVVVRRRPAPAGHARRQAGRVGRFLMPRERHYLPRTQLAQTHGAHPMDLAAVEAFATRHKLAVLEKHRARRTVVLSGSVANVERAFGVSMMRFKERGLPAYQGHAGPVRIPHTLAPVVEAVLGLTTRR